MPVNSLSERVPPRAASCSCILISCEMWARALPLLAIFLLCSFKCRSMVAISERV